MAPRVRSHRDLIVWQRAMELVLECYRLSSELPREERFELAVQLRRASVSIAANIAEGCGRRTRKEIAAFLTIARGSLREVETYFDIMEALEYHAPERLTTARRMAVEIGKMLNALRRSLTLPPHGRSATKH